MPEPLVVYVNPEDGSRSLLPVEGWRSVRFWEDADVRVIADDLVRLDARDTLAANEDVVAELADHYAVDTNVVYGVLGRAEDDERTFPESEAVKVALRVKALALADDLPEVSAGRHPCSCATCTLGLLAGCRWEVKASELAEVAREAASHLRRLPATSERQDILIAEKLEEVASRG